MTKYATAERPDRAGLVDFLRPRHHAVLITRRGSGGLQTSPVTCGIDEAGRLVVATYPQRAKVANIRRDPAVSACVLSDEWNGPYVHLDGTAEVVDLPEAVEPLVEYFRSVSTASGRSTISAVPSTWTWGPLNSSDDTHN